MEVPVLLEVLDLGVGKGVLWLGGRLFHIFVLGFLLLYRLLLVIGVLSQGSKGLAALSWRLAANINTSLLLFGVLDILLPSRLLRNLFLLLLVLGEVLPLFREGAFGRLLRGGLIRIGLVDVLHEGLRVLLEL